MTTEPGWTDRIARPPAPAPGEFVGPRTKLLRAGQELLLERGDSSYTIEELVRRAGVGIKTFYRCFDTKDEFLQQVFVTAVAGSTPRVREAIMGSSDDPLARLRLAVTWPTQWHREQDPASLVIAAEHMRIAVTSPQTIAESARGYEDLLRELIGDAARAGLVRPVDLEWDVHIINTMVTTSFHTLILGLGLGDHDTKALAHNVWRFCLTALRGRPDDLTELVGD